jgi:hypothetical protein
MPKSKLTAREKSRQERERAKSLADRSRQQVKKAAQLQEKARRKDVIQSAARLAQDVTEKDPMERQSKPGVL